MSEPTEVHVRLNGESCGLVAGLTIASLVREMGRDPRTVAVEYNGHILTRSHYEETMIQEGDRIEVVQFVQGG